MVSAVGHPATRTPLGASPIVSVQAIFTRRDDLPWLHHVKLISGFLHVATKICQSMASVGVSFSERVLGPRRVVLIETSEHLRDVLPDIETVLKPREREGEPEIPKPTSEDVALLEGLALRITAIFTPAIEILKGGWRVLNTPGRFSVEAEAVGCASILARVIVPLGLLLGDETLQVLRNPEDRVNMNLQAYPGATDLLYTRQDLRVATRNAVLPSKYFPNMVVGFCRRYLSEAEFRDLRFIEWKGGVHACLGTLLQGEADHAAVLVLETGETVEKGNAFFQEERERLDAQKKAKEKAVWKGSTLLPPRPVSKSYEAEDLVAKAAAEEEVVEASSKDDDKKAVPVLLDIAPGPSKWPIFKAEHSFCYTEVQARDVFLMAAPERDMKSALDTVEKIKQGKAQVIVLTGAPFFTHARSGKPSPEKVFYDFFAGDKSPLIRVPKGEWSFLEPGPGIVVKASTASDFGPGKLYPPLVSYRDYDYTDCGIYVRRDGPIAAAIAAKYAPPEPPPIPIPLPKPKPPAKKKR
ncbi:MAG: hypothetical protein JSR76_00630 [Verrucomicrobia bacterium]|nr:hypothetical protein [Verrucomicrobiota bacterium]